MGCARLAWRRSAQCWKRPAEPTRIVVQSSASACSARLRGSFGLAQRRLSRCGAPTCSALPCASDGGRRSCVARSRFTANGTDALRRFGAGGARAEAAAGFPHALSVGLPALRLGRALAPGDPIAARVQSFFALLEATEDTNLLY